jgi:PAS domain S-box-containing protein
MPLAVRALLLVLLALVPAALVQTQLEQEARGERAQQLGAEAMRLTRLVAGQQLRVFEGAQHLLNAMAAHEALRAGVPNAECDLFLARLLRGYTRYIAANLFDLEGRRVCAAAPELPAGNVADRPYFQAVRAGAPFAVGEYTRGRATGAPSLHFASPLRSDAGVLAGVVVVALSLDWMHDDLEALPLPAGAAASIIDGRGVVLARTPDGGRFVGTTVPGFAFEAATAMRPSLRDGESLDGERRIAGFMPVPAAPIGLTVAVGLAADTEIAAELERDRRTAFLIIGSLLLTLVLAIGAFHILVERPVSRLLGAAQAWSRQEWAARVGPLGGGREFERIGSALDLMADALQRAEAARVVAAIRVKALSDVSPQVVFTADARGNIDWLNGYWRNLTGRDIAHTTGAGWLRAVHPADVRRAVTAWRAALAEAAAGGAGEFHVELRLLRAEDRAWRWFFCRAAPIRDSDGEVTAWAGVALDFDELRRAREALAEQSQRLQATYSNAPVGLCLLDRRLRFLAVNTLFAEIQGAAAEEHLGHGLAELAPRLAAMLVPRLQRLIADGEPLSGVEIDVTQPPLDGLDQPRRVLLCGFHPVLGEGGEVVAVSGSMLDITARKRAEEAEQMLSREVDHRAKNVLAVVRSLVRISAAEAPDDVEALVQVLEGRISAVARVHTILSHTGWEGADLRDIALEETAAYGSRVRREGPPLRLIAQAAQAFAMVLHELLTNAAKHGCFSAPEGHLVLRWERVGRGAQLSWTEHGGPILAGPPSRSGFGTQLIDANAGTPLDGHIERYWEAAGLRCVLHIGPNALPAAP